MSLLNFRHPILLTFILLLPVAVLAQQTPAASPTPVGRAVKLNLIVTDKNNHSLTDLKKEEVQLREDGVPQTLTLFEKDTRPARYVIALDTSGSFKDLLPSVLAASKVLIDANGERDETMLQRFISSDKIEKVEEFTSDKAKLVGALPKFVIEDGQSAVIDALYIAVRSATEYKSGDSSARRAVVLFSDGEDRASYYTADTLVKLLRASEVQVFVIGIVAKLDGERGLTRPSPKQKAEKLLTRVAAESGGRVFFPKDLPELAVALQEINKDLQTQFLVGYESSVLEPNKNFRNVKVDILQPPGSEKRSAITKPGYFLSPPELDVKKRE